MSRLFLILFRIRISSRNLFAKHNFDKIFPVPQFTFNHNNLSYYYGYSTKTLSSREDNLTDCSDYILR
ncbi:hypothetical protein CO700_16090 [Citrobacter koseri]|uniref:Uncharacterized protein n=1 Tax=Citrobacter koseri (strain ATCC BAA-895 / CDC 4225-83 / SGSC4696) TaxID=290338 RepID=A8ADB8_CITK8|nr:hypothetical protein CKO_00318 [Citrobacter koseri ATCC BAA-895]ATF98454.1 hypothetical protein CO700_16090 [Citrobacter koseri]KWZ95468.1 hypothetical protein HMPREF3220_04119 [Citrobacter koseri]KXA05349.1 hypothetical protein HMPREF3207_00831 [Citrobacter koseri]KXB45129.1 hypothetical protein HMPREF0208_01514 [Citrobacter koseri]